MFRTKVNLHYNIIICIIMVSRGAEENAFFSFSNFDQ